MHVLVKMVTELKFKKKLPKNPLVIEAFPSKGFVSTIAAKYMIDELGMEVVGCIRSDKVQSIAVVHDSTPMYPIRIYMKDDIVLLFSEVNVPFQYVGEFTEAISRWFRDIKPREVLLLAGISGRSTEKKHEIFGITSDKKIRKKLRKLDVVDLVEGMLTGVSSDLLLFCMDEGIPVTSLMVETNYTPDPLGSASMLKIISQLLDVDIDTKKLVEKGQEVEKMFYELSDQMKKGMEDTKEMSGYSPMYG